MKKGFTLVELLVVITIIGILSSVGLNTFTSAQKKSRDAERKTHLKQLADSFEAYYNDKGEYPDDDGAGNILGCGEDAEDACVWGTSAFSNTTPDPDTIYMIKLPQDVTVGQSYYFQSFTTSGVNNRYQLYARLENTEDIDVSKDADGNPLVYDSLNCGANPCNYGVSSTNMTAATGRTLVLE
jgi:prepilin-type N-terminal cleavage/methylation domain-containing protein